MKYRKQACDAFEEAVKLIFMNQYYPVNHADYENLKKDYSDVLRKMGQLKKRKLLRHAFDVCSVRCIIVNMVKGILIESITVCC